MIGLVIQKKKSIYRKIFKNRNPKQPKQIKARNRTSDGTDALGVDERYVFTYCRVFYNIQMYVFKNMYQDEFRRIQMYVFIHVRIARP